ncbi:hypothetical protein FDP41_010765 [Naegleria fowleri]|uniref:Uncharacterized protein n=1 Tax=Naegleria fowleri TaxID=5763 RepID=A0A6A5C4W3_NAEFO|nr:uncharacterized protein FDP41_010765 [Naegleria fowleri]KAF0982786.1 hypothetical protein FDP41_010765 [Naegleria fowleri]
MSTLSNLDSPFRVNSSTAGEVSVFFIPNLGREYTPQDISINTLNSYATRISPFSLFLFYKSSTPYIIKENTALRQTAQTPSQFLASSIFVESESTLIVVGNQAVIERATFAIKVPQMYLNPPTIASDTATISQVFKQSPSGIYPVAVAFNLPQTTTTTMTISFLVQKLAAVQQKNGVISKAPPVISIVGIQDVSTRTLTIPSFNTTYTCLPNSNTDSLYITSYLPLSGMNGKWRFQLVLDPSYTSTETVVSINAQTRSEFYVPSSNQIGDIQMGYTTALVSDFEFKMSLPGYQDKMIYTFTFNSNDLYFKNRFYEIYFAIGFKPTLQYYHLKTPRLKIGGVNQAFSFNLKYVSQQFIISNLDSSTVYTTNSYTSLVDKSMYILIHPIISSSTDANIDCTLQSNTAFALFKVEASKKEEERTLILFPDSTLRITPKATIRVITDSVNKASNYGKTCLIEFVTNDLNAFSESQVPVLSERNIFSQDVTKYPMKRLELVSLGQSTKTLLKFYYEIHISKSTPSFSYTIQIPDGSFSELTIQGSVEVYTSLPKLLLDDFYLGTYISTGCIVASILFYILVALLVFGVQTCRGILIDLSDNHRWAGCIPAKIVALPILFTLCCCSPFFVCCSNRTNKRKSALCCASLCWFLLGFVTLCGFGIVFGMLISDVNELSLVSTGAKTSPHFAITSTVMSCCETQGTPYSFPWESSSPPFRRVGDILQCINSDSLAGVYRYTENDMSPTTPVSYYSITGGQTAVAFSRMYCKGSKVSYLPKYLDMSRVFGIVTPFGFIFLLMAFIHWCYLLLGSCMTPTSKESTLAKHNTTMNAHTKDVIINPFLVQDMIAQSVFDGTIKDIELPDTKITASKGAPPPPFVDVPPPPYSHALQNDVYAFDRAISVYNLDDVQQQPVQLTTFISQNVSGNMTC